MPISIERRSDCVGNWHSRVLPLGLPRLIRRGRAVVCGRVQRAACEVFATASAKALGLKDTGEIAVGKAADLCVVDLNRTHLTPALDIPNLVVNSMGADDVKMTIVDGRVVYEKGSGDNGFNGWPAAATAREGLLSAVKRIGL